MPRTYPENVVSAVMLRSVALACTLVLIALSTHSHAAPVAAPTSKTASEIYWSLQKLDTLGRALYLAAHPDDENTSLISYLSLGRKYDTAYLSLTRGDGGQNLIGPELREQLGVIRTQELIEARKIDGGLQFFSRAKDFGYSKHAEETFNVWDRDAVLADVVWVIRTFRPDVIITRFSPEPGYTHGHHTASAMLAIEGFEAAADPKRFPEQLEWVEPWRATRVVWNTSSWFFQRSGQSFDESEYVKVDVGGYDPLLGKSYNEIASASRSMHRSQGFGTRIDRGSRTEYFKLLAGAPLETDLFEGVNTSWGRVPGAKSVGDVVEQLVREFQFEDPAASVPGLIALRTALESLDETEWSRRKQADVDRLIMACMGLDIRAVAEAPYVGRGDELKVQLEAINRSGLEARVVRLELPFAEKSWSYDANLPFNEGVQRSELVTVPRDMALPQPYWLEQEGSLGLFDVTEQRLIGSAENEPRLLALARIEVGGAVLEVALPLVYREVDPAFGERIKPVALLPKASVSFASEVSLFPNYEAREVQVKVSALLSPIEGSVELTLPAGWSSIPKRQKFDRIPLGAERFFSFLVQPPKRSESAEIGAIAKTSQGDFSISVTRIEYEHIDEQILFEPAGCEAISLEVARAGQRIGYLPGAGDSVPASLREMGYEVVELSANAFEPSALEDLDTVVVGIRAYNTVEGIAAIMEELYRFAEGGGTVVVQYNTSHRLQLDNVAPFPLTLSRDRVTDEFAEVRVLRSDHPVLNVPNKIGASDFEGWVQERGLYFPDKWSGAFAAVLSVNDAGEPPRDGSLLVAEYGEGYFVYTGLSWFRQLPAGVPGAYRIFANIVSLGHDRE